jgi:hypothetical protein
MPFASFVTVTEFVFTRSRSVTFVSVVRFPLPFTDAIKLLIPLPSPIIGNPSTVSEFNRCQLNVGAGPAPTSVPQFPFVGEDASSLR